MIRLYRFRSVEEVVGTFVLVTAVAGLALVVLAGRAQHWFEPRHELTVDLPATAPEGLVGKDVRMLGDRVGEVLSLERDDAGRLSARIELQHARCSELRLGTRAEIRESELPPSTWIELELGEGAVVRDVASLRIPCTDAPGLLRMGKQLVVDAGEEIAALVPLARELLTAHRDLAEGLAADGGPLAPNLLRIERILEGLEAGRGPAGRMLASEEWAESLDESITTMHAAFEQIEQAAGSVATGAGDIAKAAEDVRTATASISKVAQELEATFVELRAATADLPELGPGTERILADAEATLANLRAASEHLPATTERLADEAAALPGTVHQARGTVREIDVLARGLQNHWMLRGSMEKRGEPGDALPAHGVSVHALESGAEERPPAGDGEQ